MWSDAVFLVKHVVIVIFFLIVWLIKVLHLLLCPAWSVSGRRFHCIHTVVVIILVIRWWFLRFLWRRMVFSALLLELILLSFWLRCFYLFLTREMTITDKKGTWWFNDRNNLKEKLLFFSLLFTANNDSKRLKIINIKCQCLIYWTSVDTHFSRGFCHFLHWTVILFRARALPLPPPTFTCTKQKEDDLNILFLAIWMQFIKSFFLAQM